MLARIFFERKDMAKKNNTEDIDSLNQTSATIRGIYVNDIEAAMDNLIAALEGTDKQNYILAARAFDYAVLYIRARMAEVDSQMSQFTVKVVEIAKKKGWYEEPKQEAKPEVPANTPKPENTKTTAKKKK